jgi:hypothetical protein
VSQCSDTSTFEELMKVVVPVVQMLVVVVGWKIVSKGNDKRERRKEVRSLLNEIRAKVLEIEGQALDYYRLAPSKSVALGTSIKQNLKHVGMLSTTIVKFHENFDLSSQLMLFRQKVSGQDFETATRQIRQADDRLFVEISSAATDLIDQMESIYSSTYC